MSRGCRTTAVFFSQLYGMVTISPRLAEQGFCVAKYVPYGEVRTMMPPLREQGKLLE